MTKPLLSQWIAAERKRHRWKVEELSSRLETAGFEAAVTTVRTWEAGRRPAPDTIAALERMFESAAPTEGDPSLSGLVVALRAHTEMLTNLVDELLRWRTEDRDRLTEMEKTVSRLARERLSERGTGARRARRVPPTVAG